MMGTYYKYSISMATKAKTTPKVSKPKKAQIDTSASVPSNKFELKGIPFASSMQSMQLQQNVLAVLALGLVLGFVLGHLWTKVSILENGGSAQMLPTDQGSQPTNEAPVELKIAKPDPDKDHWKGPEDAQLVHVEYSDFECPFCKTYNPTVMQLEKEYGDKMAFVYRHFPLSFHPLAQPTAEASECVASLGGNTAFWKFHDLMFERMPAVTIDGLGALAAEAGVSSAAFQTCYDGGKMKEVVTAQFNEGSKAGVGATPTSVIYDMKSGKTAAINGALPFDQVKAIVDGML